MSPLSDTDGEVGRVMQPLPPPHPPPVSLSDVGRQTSPSWIGPCSLTKLSPEPAESKHGAKGGGGGRGELQLKTAVCVDVSVRGNAHECWAQPLFWLGRKCESDCRPK